MATRRMRIKAVIKVGRGPKQEDVTVGASVDPSPFSPGAPQSPKIGVPSSPVPPRVNTPPILIPASPQSPTTSGSSHLQRPSPSKSPACLPPTGSILRRSPSPALCRLTTSPGPSPSPIKSPIPYGSPLSPTKYGRSSALVLSHFSDPQIDTYHVKSPVAHVFRPPPSPSPSFQEYQGVKSPQVISRPSPSQSPLSRPSPSPSPGFLAHHFNSNSNSLDSHEVAQFMAPSSPAGLYPPDKRGRDSACTEINFPGHSVFGNLSSQSPSFSKTIFDNPEMLKKRAEENRKKEQIQGTSTKFALARKDFYEKLHAGQLPEKNKMTMLHFTFYNPPDPNKPKKSRSRASSVCSDVSVVSKHENDNFLVPPTNENLRKASSAPSSIAGSRRTTASSVGSAGSNPSSEPDSVKLGPRVKVGPDGQLIIDEQSLVMETSESQRARQQIEDMEVVSGAEYAVGSSGFFRYKKNYRRGNDWKERETLKFYKALVHCGTDFSMMNKYFPYRTRHELKSKFNREDRKNPGLITKALQNCVFDPDEEISSEEDEGKDTEKEVVGCVGGELQLQPEPKKKRLKKEKPMEIQFTKEQLEEMKGSISKGAGTGKGRKWNTPVEGLVGGKLPPLREVKLEEVEVKKKKKKKSVKKKPSQPVPPGLVPIIVTGGIIRETISLGSVKMEKGVEIGSQKVVAGAGEGGVRRNRAKLKPNVKGIRKSGEGDVVIADSSQPKKVVGVCDELFRFDASDPAGLKVVPAPLLPVTETVLEGNEEGSEDLVLVDLDELNRIQKGGESEAVPPKKRKWRKNEGAVVVKLANTSKDPYVISSGGKEPVPSTSSEVGPSKKVKALPFRVPGPGGLLPPSQPEPSSELVLEINFNKS